MDAADPPKVDASFSAGPAPIGGLGNYKGVMLCNRPPDDGIGPRGGADGDTHAPFVAAAAPTYRDPLGLPPCKKHEQFTEVKTRGPSAALRRHCQWIKELQGQVKEEQQRAGDIQKQNDERKQNMQEIFKQQRDAIRSLKKEQRQIEPHELEAILRPKAKKKAKPLWAMTDAEREDFEEEEAADLIQFADDLDFDKYVGDLEFRQCLQAVSDRAKKLQRERDAFKDALIQEYNGKGDDDDDESSTGDTASALGDGLSQRGGRRPPGATGRPGVDHRPDWDSSTAYGDDHGSVDHDVKSVAESVLEARPHMKGVHSKGSVQRIIEKVRDSPAVVN